jgi:hypothetical protein
MRGRGAAEESVKRFELFMACYRDAREHGFTGEIEFGP